MNDDLRIAFAPATIEDTRDGRAGLDCRPDLPNGLLSPFPIDDPFGLRKAIVPVLQEDTNGNIESMGTAFFADEWVTLITAEHVVADCFTKQHTVERITELKEPYFEGRATKFRPRVGLGVGIIVGRPDQLPYDPLVPVSKIQTRGFVRDNPMSIPGQRDSRSRMKPIDFCTMRLEKPPPPQLRANLPIRLDWTPTVGDVVMGVGYRKLDDDSDTQSGPVRTEFCAAFGVITGRYAQGISANQYGASLVVEAEWPGGMSGGPVFNHAGEVIGIVSSGWNFQESRRPESSLLVFGLMPKIADDLPTVDPTLPNWRKGWAVKRASPWEILGFLEFEYEAQVLASALGPDCEIEYGSREIGTDNFICGDVPTGLPEFA